MISKLLPLIERAERGRYAIPAFNVTNLETIIAVVRAAVRTKSPVIIQTSESAIAYAGHEPLLRLIEMIAAREGRAARIVTHLDHGKHSSVVHESVRLGYCSVHMDASERPYRENIRRTKEAVTFAHRRGVPVQGELGYLFGHEGMTSAAFTIAAMQAAMTDPDQAAEFVALTGIDTLAVAVGTAHGIFRGRESVDSKRLAAIRSKIKIPLVLHGGSGAPRQQIRKSIAIGVRIVNIDTALRVAYAAGLRASVGTVRAGSKIDIREIMMPATAAMERVAIEHIRLLGSNGHAR